MEVINSYKDAIKVMDKDFVMIVAKSRTCSSCQTIGRTLESHIPNLGQIEQHNIYIDEIDEFRGHHLIFSVPTVIIFSNGKELLRESRYINYEKVQRLIKMYNS